MRSDIGFGKDLTAVDSTQSYTSEMLREDLDGGWIRYHCQDFGLDAEFTSLVFKIRVEPQH